MEPDVKNEPPPYSEAIQVQVLQPVVGNPYLATNTFIQQPAACVVKELPNNYGAAAWLSCIFCFWPFGIMSIVKSKEVDTAISQGDIYRAHIASNSAKSYAIASVVCGIFLAAIIILKFSRIMF